MHEFMPTYSRPLVCLAITDRGINSLLWLTHEKVSVPIRIRNRKRMTLIIENFLFIKVTYLC